MKSLNPWRDLAAACAAGLIVFVFCLLLLWHDPLVFWNDDYELSILPVFADIARSWNEGHFPLLSPYSWVCNNLAGEFQYGTFSVFVNAAVVLVWKFPLTFPLQAAALSITHLFILGMGAFLLARDRQLSVALSVFVALVSTLSGWIICWGATDWFGALGAFTWLPWAWWGLERALDRQRSRWRFLWPAPFVYLLVTGGFPYTVVMLLLLIAWFAIKSLVQTRSSVSILPMLFGAALGFGLSAPAWLALLDYVRGSAREFQPVSLHWQWLVPPAALPAFILPSWTVNWSNFSGEHLPHTGTELACGVVAPSALLAGFLWRPRLLMSRMKWELILLGVLLLLCMVPTVGLFRWSFRWLPFLHLVLAICAAEALHIRRRTPTASMSILLLLAITIAMSLLHTAGSYGADLTFVYFQIAVIWVIGEWFLRNRWFWQWSPALATFSFLLATYLCLPTNCGVPKFHFDQQLLKPAPLDRHRLYLSFYPPPETDYRIKKKTGPVGQTVRPGSTSMWAGLRFINGYSPIRPAGVAREFGFATHGEIDSSMDDYVLQYQAGPTGKLALLGVDGIIVAREIDVDPQPASEWQRVASNDEGRVFHRCGPPLARVRSLTAIDSRPGQKFAEATISHIKDSRNEAEADVDVPPGDHSALLVFSRPYFRGYKAWINQEKLVVESADGLAPLLEIPPGTSGRLHLVYRPVWLLIGAITACVCAIVMLTALCFRTSAIRHSSSQ